MEDKFNHYIEELLKPFVPVVAPIISPIRQQRESHLRATERDFVQVLERGKHLNPPTERTTTGAIKKDEVLSNLQRKPQGQPVRETPRRQTEPIKPVKPIHLTSCETLEIGAIIEVSPALQAPPVENFLDFHIPASIHDEYVSLVAATVWHIQQFNFPPTALYVSSSLLSKYLEAVERVEQRQSSMLRFAGNNIRILTEHNMPEWLKIILHSNIPEDYIYTAA